MDSATDNRVRADSLAAQYALQRPALTSRTRLRSLGEYTTIQYQKHRSSCMILTVRIGIIY